MSMKKYLLAAAMVAAFVLPAIGQTAGQGTRIKSGASVPGSCIDSSGNTEIFIKTGTGPYYCDGGTYAAVGGGGGSGTVTSVGLSAPSTFSVGGTPVTGSGTLALTYNVGAADEAVISTAANTASWSSITNCGDSSHAVSYSTTTHTFGCQAITAGTGTVTSIATTTPITGGTITSTGTIACPTCVTSAASLTSGQLVAGAGSQASQVTNLSGDVTTSGGVATTVAKIQGTTVSGTTGSTNVVFSASPDLTGSPTAPTQTSTDNSTKIATTAFVQNYAPGGSGAAITFWTPNGTVAGNTSVVAANVVRIAHFFLPVTVSFNTIGVQNVTADGTNKYSFGVFSLAGTTRYAHTTEQVMTGTGTFRALAVSEGTVTLAPGDYLFAWTGAATTATFLTLGSGVGTRLAPSSSTTTTSLGVMPAAPINVPALSPNQAATGIVSFILYQ